jgi:CheY-like chemotaxis protein
MGNEAKINKAARSNRELLQGGTILLVEDSDDDVELTLRALKRNGFTNKIVTMRDGAQALDYLNKRGTYNDRQDGKPALILLDLKLPRVDGLEVLDQIKSNPELKVVPVIMLTSSRQARDVNQAYQLGVNSYVCKPTDFSEFLRMVADIGRYWFRLVELPVG